MLSRNSFAVTTYTNVPKVPNRRFKQWASNSRNFQRLRRLSIPIPEHRDRNLFLSVSLSACHIEADRLSDNGERIPLSSAIDREPWLEFDSRRIEIRALALSPSRTVPEDFILTERVYIARRMCKLGPCVGNRLLHCTCPRTGRVKCRAAGRHPADLWSVWVINRSDSESERCEIFQSLGHSPGKLPAELVDVVRAPEKSI